MFRNTSSLLLISLLLCGPAPLFAIPDPATETLSLNQSIDIHSVNEMAVGEEVSRLNRGVDRQIDYRGWEYVAQRLIDNGISEKAVIEFFRAPIIPPFAPIPFAVAPEEAKRIYLSFYSKKNLGLARDFLKLHQGTFSLAENRFGVPREVVAAILLVETQLGRNTGQFLVSNRLARLVGLASPENVEWNYRRLKRSDKNLKLSTVADRAQYLESTFLPELVALFELSEHHEFSLLKLRGSRAGAFGLPQFLPSSFRDYAVDGDGDGHRSLFNTADAIHSVGRYLQAHGWNNGIKDSEKQKVIWHYNRSQAYVDTILALAKRLD